MIKYEQAPKKKLLLFMLMGGVGVDSIEVLPIDK